MRFFGRPHPLRLRHGIAQRIRFGSGFGEYWNVWVAHEEAPVYFLLGVVHVSIDYSQGYYQQKFYYRFFKKEKFYELT